jgi:putative DNA primase/helicase
MREATWLPVNPSAIPEALKRLSQWMCWRGVWLPDKQKWDKVPLIAGTHRKASSTNPKTWTTFAAVWKVYQQGGVDGIGFGVLQANQLTGIDLDDCRDPDSGEIVAWAQAIVDRLQTYTEVSPSGTGLRLWLYATREQRGRRKGHIEVYSWGRYLTLTGCHVDGTPTTIEPRQAELDAFERETFSKAQKSSTPPASTNGTGAHLDDEALLSVMLGAKNGLDIAKLWRGESDGYPSDSEADLALCNHFAFYTGGDAAAMDRLFRKSGLMRDKWERADYREATIHKAVAETPERYHPSGRRRQNDRPPKTNDEQPPIHLTDRGNALRLVNADGRDLHYIYRWKKWLVWDGRRWVIDEGQMVEQRAKRVITELYREAKAIIDELSQLAEPDADMSEEAYKIRQHKLAVATNTLKWALKSESAERLSGMLKHARSERGIAITPDQLDANPWLLNCANGTINLRTGTLQPHRREDLCTKQLTIAYHPGDACPYWQRFLWRIMGGPAPDEEGSEEALLERYDRAQRLITFLQRAVGYSLTGVIRQQVLFFMYGGGDNGKSTFSETLAALMGEYYQKAPKELLMQRDRQAIGGPSPEIARLFGVRLVIASEVGEHHRLNEAQVKDLTGDDTLTARGLYEAFFDFRPTHKLWMYGNHKPSIQGTDDAIWKRPKLIPFAVKIPPSEQIPDFREEHLLPELPGILAWAVQGCRDWQKDGLRVPDEVEIATASYRKEMDALAAFLEEHCLMGADYTVKGSMLYAKYSEWGDSGREVVLRRRKFYDQLRERGCESFSGNGNAVTWRGVGLKEDTQTLTHM